MAESATETILIRVELEPRELDVHDYWSVQGPLADVILDKLLELGVLNAAVSSEVTNV